MAPRVACNVWGLFDAAPCIRHILLCLPHYHVATGAGVDGYPLSPALAPTTPGAHKPMLPITPSQLGREGSKFYKFYKDTLMEYIQIQVGIKNKSLQQLPPSLPIWVGSNTGAFFVLHHVAHFSPTNPPVISETFNANHK